MLGMAYGALQTESLVDRSWPLSLVLGLALQLSLWALFGSLELLKLSQAMAVLNAEVDD